VKAVEKDFAMAYTIRLVGLECFKPQEIDGDEIYVTLNGEKVWEARPDTMNSVLERDENVSHFDFAEGRKLTSDGWVSMPGFQPEQVTFALDVGAAALELWDADLLTRDDLLGEAGIDAGQASGGSISLVFQRLGAHYRLTYRVELK
jgi:hypothetical protein